MNARKFLAIFVMFILLPSYPAFILHKNIYGIKRLDETNENFSKLASFFGKEDLRGFIKNGRISALPKNYIAQDYRLSVEKISEISIKNKKRICITIQQKTLYVGGNGPDNYTRIQDAIDDAEDGYTIFVYSGTYYENITIDKSIKLIGENVSTCIIDGTASATYFLVRIEADGVQIQDFTLKNRYGLGVYAAGTKECIISNCIFSDIEEGIWFKTATSFEIHGCKFDDTDIAIFIEQSNNSVISHNFFFFSSISIFIERCENITVDENIFEKCKSGVCVTLSNYTTIKKSFFNQNEYVGIEVSDSYSCYLIDNVLEGCGVIITGNFCDSHIIMNNTVNRKPLCYLVNEKDIDVPYDVGQIILVNCKNVTVHNLLLEKCSVGISLLECWNCRIYNNICYGNFYGVLLQASYGNLIQENNCSNNVYAIDIEGDGNDIVRNYLSNNEIGISLYGVNNRVIDNKMLNCGLFTFSAYNDISNNTVNGRKLYFLVEQENISISSEDAGQVILIGCKNVSIKNATLNNCSAGIIMYRCSGCGILNNRIAGNLHAILVSKSSSCTFYENLIYCNENGINTFHSHNLSVLNNHFLKNEWGFSFLDGNNCSVINNTFDSTLYSIVVAYASKSLITNNYIERSENAIAIGFEGRWNKILNNTIRNSGLGLLINGYWNWIINNTLYGNVEGVQSLWGDTNLFKGNVFEENEYAMDLIWCTSNEIMWNIFRNNNYSIISWGEKNKIHHNLFIENWHKAYDFYRNRWDDGREGNYWSDYRGFDINRDGIGDLPYKIRGWFNFDRYPLMHMVNLTAYIDKPRGGIYIMDRKIFPLPFGITMVFGDISIHAISYGINAISKLEFYIDGELKEIVYANEFETKIEMITGWHVIEVVAHDTKGREARDTVGAWFI